MKAAKIYLSIIMLLLVLGFTSCKKYLDKQPNKNLIVPKNLSDLQSLLDYNIIMNKYYTDVNELIAGDFNFRDLTFWAGRSADVKFSYVWDKNADFAIEWNNTPSVYYNANVVLEALPKLSNASNKIASDNIKGQALFFRSFAFYHLAQLYCPPYSTTATSDLGLPLRLTSDFNAKSVRFTVEQTYNQILNDFKEAARLLPEQVLSPTRPGKAAAYGVLARTYLSMRDYVNAGKYADSCLQLSNALMDYNTLNSSSVNPIPNLNPEIVFWSVEGYIVCNITNSDVAVDSGLYRSYNDNDLRKVVFYQLNTDGTYGFKGSYGFQRNDIIFNGIAADEMYLIRAEALARAGNRDAALSDLNALVSKRWKNTVSYPPITATDANDALAKILAERRRELVARGQRWMDLRRLNIEGADLTLTRVINGANYTLPPNDLRWVLLFPSSVTTLSDIQQNPR